MSNSKIEDILSLVEQNFEFLHVGAFLNYHATKENLSSKTIDIQRTFENEKTYCVSMKCLTEDALSQYHKLQTATVFGYLVEWNAIRGVSMAMVEGIKLESYFKKFIENQLGNRYKHYYAILCFIRNVLSHNIDNEIRLKQSDYEGTKESFLKYEKSLKKEPSGIAKFDVNYCDVFPNLNAPRDYVFDIEVNFKGLQPNECFLDVISELHLLMFTEFCFNLVKLFRLEEKAKLTAAL